MKRPRSLPVGKDAQSQAVCPRWGCRLGRPLQGGVWQHLKAQHLCPLRVTPLARLASRDQASVLTVALLINRKEPESLWAAEGVTQATPSPRLQCTGHSCAWCGAKEARPRGKHFQQYQGQAGRVIAPGHRVVTSKAGRGVAKVEGTGRPF